MRRTTLLLSALALTLTVTLASATAPCATSGECAPGHVCHPPSGGCIGAERVHGLPLPSTLLPGWASLFVAVGAAAAVAVVATIWALPLVGINGIVPSRWTPVRRVELGWWASLVLPVVIATFVTTILIVANYVVPHPLPPLGAAPLDTATNCSVVATDVCEPYVCDTRVGHCLLACASDLHCAVPTRCDSASATCVLDLLSPSVPGLRKRLVSPYTAAFLATAAALLSFCAALVAIMLCAYPRTHTGVIIILAALVAVAVGTAVGVGFGTRSVPITWPLPPRALRPVASPPPPPPLAPPAPPSPPPHQLIPVACKASPSCRPYFCDMANLFCYDYCETDDNCVTGFECVASQCLRIGHSKTGIVEHTVAPVIAFVVAFFIGCFAATCAMVCARVAAHRTHRRYRGALDYLVCAAAFAFTLLLLFLFTSLESEVDLPLARPANATAATHPHAPDCAELNADVCNPFLCDVRVGACWSRCNRDLECAPGTVCVDSACVAKVTSPRLRYRPFPTWLWSAIVVGASTVGALIVLATLCALRPVSLARPELTRRDAAALGAQLLSCCATGTVILLVLAVALSQVQLSRTPLPALSPARAASLAALDPPPLNSPGWNVSCIHLRDPTCEPYLCDAASRACYPSCDTSLECSPGHECIHGACVATLAYPLLPPLPAALTTALAIHTAAIATLVGGAVLVCGATPRRLIAYGLQPLHTALLILAADGAAAVVYATLGLPLLQFYPLLALPPALVRSNTTCGPLVADARCFPYACDTRLARCTASCQHDTHCATGASQRPYSCAPDGSCLPAPSHTLLGSPSTTALFATATAALILAWLVLICYPTLRRRIRHLARIRTARASAARSAALSTAMAKYANVARPLLDIVPGGAPSPPLPNDPNPDVTADVERGVEMDSCSRSSSASDDGVGVGTLVVSPSSGDDTSGSELPQCVICFGDGGQFWLGGRRGACDHWYCGPCAAATVEATLDAGRFPATCPGCLAESGAWGVASELPGPVWTSADAVEALVACGEVDADTGRRMIINMVLAALPSTETTSCPACGLLGVKAGLDSAAAVEKRASRKARVRARASSVVCAHCDAAYCGECGILWAGHVGVACGQAGGMTDLMSQSLIHDTAKACPSCATPITSWFAHGCHHVHCGGCGYDFCIVCLQRHPHPPHPDHALFCSETCGCVVCPDCRPGAPCPQCPPANTNCPACFPDGPFGHLLPDGHMSRGFAPNAGGGAEDTSSIDSGDGAGGAPAGDGEADGAGARNDDEAVQASFSSMMQSLQRMLVSLQPAAQAAREARAATDAGAPSAGHREGEGAAIDGDGGDASNVADGGGENEEGRVGPSTAGGGRRVGIASFTTPAQELILDEFVAVTGVARRDAWRLLRAADWDLQEATDAHFEAQLYL